MIFKDGGANLSLVLFLLSLKSERDSVLRNSLENFKVIGEGFPGTTRILDGNWNLSACG